MKINKIMKYLLLLTGLLFIIGCNSDDDSCFETWKYREYCETSEGCNIVGCQTPTIGEKRFKCSEVSDVNPGDVVLIRTVDCAKFYIEYLDKVD